MSLYHVAGDEGEDPRSIVIAAIETGAAGILADHGNLPDRFFDLSTRYAGEMLHELSKYGIALAVVVPDVAVHSQLFQEFAAEANTRREIQLVTDRKAAEEWLKAVTE